MFVLPFSNAKTNSTVVQLASSILSSSVQLQIPIGSISSSERISEQWAQSLKCS